MTISTVGDSNFSTERSIETTALTPGNTVSKLPDSAPSESVDYTQPLTGDILTSCSRNLKAELDSLEKNILTRTDLNVNDKELRDLYVKGGTRSAIACGVTGFAISLVAGAPIVGLLAAVSKKIGMPVTILCGAAGGLAVGAWAGIRFAKAVNDKHPGMAGVGIALMAGILGVATGVVAGAVVGAAGGAICNEHLLGIMAMGVGFGTFKLSLLILEPMAEHFIAKPYGDKAENMRPNDTTVTKLTESELTESDIQKLQEYNKKPVTQALNYWCNNIWSPPIHPEVKQMLDNQKESLLTQIDRAIDQGVSSLVGSKPEYEPKQDMSQEAFTKVISLTQAREFTNAAQAWQNFDKIAKTFGSSESSTLRDNAKASVLANYGPRPSLLEKVTCGTYQSGRIALLTEQIAALQSQIKANSGSNVST